MSEKVLTTLVVRFEGNAENTTTVTEEADEVLNIDEEGEVKTSFYGGDDYNFLLYLEGPGKIKSISSSWGGVFYTGEVSRSRSDILDFVTVGVADDNPKLSYVPAGALTMEFWVGQAGNNLKINGTTKTVAINSGLLPCKAIVKYPVSFKAYKLVPKPIPENLPDGVGTFDILILVVLED